MNRIDKTITRLRETNRKMLSPYITAGDPEPGLTVEIMHKLVEAGADVLEIGIPFSDPMAEGPVIQAAMERALMYKIGCDDVFDMLAAFRKTDKDTPIVLMGYLNPIEQYGYERFVNRAVQAGADGTIIVDLPPEESHDLAPIWDKAGLHPIYLCSPTTSADRMALINQYGRGYLYYVSLKGVTGATLDLESLKKEYLKREQQTQLPLMVGFGIKTPEMAQAVAEFSDGVIVGAALIDEIHKAYTEQANSSKAGASLMQSMRMAMDKNWNKK